MLLMSLVRTSVTTTNSVLGDGYVTNKGLAFCLCTLFIFYCFLTPELMDRDCLGGPPHLFAILNFSTPFPIFTGGQNSQILTLDFTRF